MPDELAADEGYPGSEAAFGLASWVHEPVGRFREHDQQRFWFLDFHWPRGITPMGLTVIEDGYSWASQFAAATLPLPEGRGLTQRIVGTHVYAAGIPVSDPWEVDQRARLLRRRLPKFVDDFDAIWSERCLELDSWWNRFTRTDLRSLSLPELGRHLIACRRFLKRATEVHFELMYPLLVNHLAFFGLCAEMGIDGAATGKFLQGYESEMSDADRALWELTRLARRSGIADVFDRYEAHQLEGALSHRGGRTASWWSAFQNAMLIHGHRAEGPFDPVLPSWNEDVAHPLAIIKSNLQHGSPPDFDLALEDARSRRADSIEAARAGLTMEELHVFNRGLAACERANFPKWQEDHNYYIDLRAALPMRWACLEISDRINADMADDGLFLFWHEIMAVVDGYRAFKPMSDLICARRQYYEFWLNRRPTMPKVLGTIPDSISDPVMMEVFGISDQFLAAVRTSASDEDDARQSATAMRGMGVSRGIASGIARVMYDTDNLDLLRPGEVLVCESITPNWTPAFSRIAACVCDSGGMLSHAAITSREYGVPAVTGLGIATATVHDGDRLEVNGSTGTVAILGSSADQGERLG